MDTVLDGVEMDPIVKLWRRMTGGHIPNIHAEIHRETEELSRVAHEFREKLEGYRERDDPFLAMIQDIWNRRQMESSDEPPAR